jgi:hypothetical protein
MPAVRREESHRILRELAVLRIDIVTILGSWRKIELRERIDAIEATFPEIPRPGEGYLAANLMPTEERTTMTNTNSARGIDPRALVDELKQHAGLPIQKRSV